MHWENIQKRAQKRFKRVSGSLLRQSTADSFSLTRNAHVMFNAVRFCCPVVGRGGERVSTGLRGLMIVEMR